MDAEKELIKELAIEQLQELQKGEPGDFGICLLTLTPYATWPVRVRCAQPLLPLPLLPLLPLLRLSPTAPVPAAARLPRPLRARRDDEDVSCCWCKRGPKMFALQPPVVEQHFPRRVHSHIPVLVQQTRVREMETKA